MASVKLKFHSNGTGEGRLFFQVIQARVVRQIKTGFRIRAEAWDLRRGEIRLQDPGGNPQDASLKTICGQLAWERARIERSIRSLEASGRPYTADDILAAYRRDVSGGDSVFAYMRRQAERLRSIGRIRTCETYLQGLNSFMRYRGGVDLYFDMLDADMVERYEGYMRARRLSRNTTSFYMRVLRCIYNRAVEEGLTVQTDPFRRVYTGVDKTAKRAITLPEIRRIKALDLSGRSDLDFARDIFMFSFYMRGMSFIDIAYLRKKDLADGRLRYIRRKTGQLLSIRWERPMQEIVDKHPADGLPYLLPLITHLDGTEREQYLRRSRFVNRKLKTIAAMAQIDFPLTMYVSRHSWASIARQKRVPLDVICEGMGHDNEETTRIYLAAIRTHRIDAANRKILQEL